MGVGCIVGVGVGEVALWGRLLCGLSCTELRMKLKVSSGRDCTTFAQMVAMSGMVV